MLELFEGRLLIHGNEGINTDVSREAAAAQAARLNTVGNLKRIAATQVLASRPLENGYTTAVLTPTAPYTERGVMFVVFPPDLKAVTKTQTLSDQPAKVQLAFWWMVIPGLVELNRLSPATINAYMENVTPITSLNHRTSRTLKLVHGQGVEIDITAIQPEPVLIDHLQKEQTYLRQPGLLENLTDRVWCQMAKAERVDFSVRNCPPVGYEFSLPADMTQADIERIQQVMHAHHQALKAVGAQELRPEAECVIPQPSYRLYQSLGNNGLHVIISPEVISHSGPMEALGVVLERVPHYPLRYPVDHTIEFIQQVARAAVFNHSALE